jgi:hypothetical protein
MPAAEKPMSKADLDLILSRRVMALYANDAAEWFHRRPLASRLDPPNRDVNAECGYPDDPQYRDFREAYDRIGLAKRIVDLWPDECFAAGLSVYETDDPDPTAFEAAQQKFDRKHKATTYLRRIDKLSRIGRYGLLLFGLDDGRPLDQPALTYNDDGTLRANSRKSGVLYLRCFDEGQAAVSEYEQSDRSFRFGQPLYYDLNFLNPRSRFIASPGVVEPVVKKRVHWTRVLHVAANREGSETFGTPELRPVFNNILDVRKISSSSPEIWWQTGFPGYQFVTDPEYALEAGLNEEELEEAIEGYVKTLQRYLANKGGKWESLAPASSPDPTNPLMAQVTLIAAAKGVPVRMLLGTESGHLASTQDSSTMKERVHGHQTDYTQPYLVDPFYQRVMDYGALPRVENVLYAWRDLKTLGDKDQAEVGLKKTQALMQYVTGDVRQLMGPRHFLTVILGLTDAQAKAVEKDLEQNPPPKPLAEQAMAQEMDIARMDADTQVKVAKATPKPAAGSFGRKPGGKPQGGGRRGTAGKSPGRPSGPPRSDR